MLVSFVSAVNNRPTQMKSSKEKKSKGKNTDLDCR